VIPPAPNTPGLRDVGDWKTVASVPDTQNTNPNAKHWHALLRLFSWQVARQSELEARIAKLEDRLTARPIVIVDDTIPKIPEVLDAIDAAERLT
jgi:hypothetical protein